ncbi:MAG TPA: creatininase family protein [Longimicrobiales bacterium]|nr:creatininase family protein [Longimicrobiales bacterium]
MTPLPHGTHGPGEAGPARPDRRWHALTTTEVAEAVRADPVVVLPLAAVEQHGPHLPLSTDLDITVGLLDRALRQIPDDLPVYTLPPQAVGASREHARFPGTLTVGSEVLAGLVEGVGRGLARAGVRRLVLFTGHGGNRHVLEGAALRLRDEEAMLVTKVHHPRLGRPPGVELPEAEWRHGLHAGAVETALMLHLRPDAVRREAIPEGPSVGEGREDGPGPAGAGPDDELELVGPEGAAPFAWLAEDLHPSGVAGRPGLATAEMGARLVEHWGRALARVLRETASFPLDRLGRWESPPG